MNIAMLCRLQPLLLSVVLTAGLCAAPAPPKAVPAFRIPLRSLGYRAVRSATLLHQSFVPNTLDFIDADNVLVTFSQHRLVPREEGDLGEDSDRLMKALVLHLPDGAVIREAEWRLHDTGRYLWPLTHGRFMLRVRSELFFVDPMRPHATMHRHTMLKPDGDIVAVQVSPDGATVLVETVPKHHIGDDPAEKGSAPVTATFFHVTEEDHPSLKVFSSLGLDKPASLPFTSHGLLKLTKEDRSHWSFDFLPFSGGKLELAGFTTQCRPDVQFVSESTFIATGCQGAYDPVDRRLLAGFDLLARPNWVFTTDDPPVWSAVSVASGESGRFAFRNSQVPTSAPTDEDDNADRHRQTVRVYEFQPGREIVRVPVVPAQHGGANFDLSPDGLRLAVLQGDALEVYALPPLSEENRRDQRREAEAVEKIRIPADVRIQVNLDDRDRQQ